MIEWVSSPSSNGKENRKLKCQKRSCQTAEAPSVISPIKFSWFQVSSTGTEQKVPGIGSEFRQGLTLSCKSEGFILTRVLFSVKTGEDGVQR